MLNVVPWQRSLFFRQRTPGKEPLLAGKDKRKDFSLCIYEFSSIIFKLVWARCPPVSGLESGFVFHYARSFIYVLSALHVNLWCRKKTKTDLMGVFNSSYIYNKQITA